VKSRLKMVVMVLCAWASVGWAQDATIYPSALLPFQERGAGVKGYGEKVGDLLFASLVVRPDFYLVERAELQKLLDEQELSLSGMVASDQATQIGKLTGAKLLITGSAIESDNALYLVAKVIGTENGRVLGVSAEGKASDALAPLVEQLAEKIGTLVAEQANQLVVPPASKEDRGAALKALLGDAPRPVISISVAERHVGQVTIDPAAETELGLIAGEAGFTVLDKMAVESNPDVLITGEGFSEFAMRRGNMVCVKARVELKAIERETGKVLAVDRQTAVVVDLSEQLAGKAALQEAAAQLAARVLPKTIGSKR
jgi:hypothetical protein